MQGVKNWTVVAKTLKTESEAVNYAQYLSDREHPNHESTKIIPLHGNAMRLAYEACQRAERLDKLNRSKKGGRPPAQQVSFNLVLPTPLGIRPTKEQWKSVAKTVLKSLAKRFDLPYQELLANCFLNAHNQKNSHLNLVFSNVWTRQDGSLETVRSLKQRQFLSHLKEAFTQAANAEFRIDNQRYEPERRDLGARLDRRRSIEQKGEAIQIDPSVRETINSNTLNRLRKLSLATEEGDQRQINRQKNRIERSYKDDPDLQRKVAELLVDPGKINGLLELAPHFEDTEKKPGAAGPRHRRGPS